MNIKRVAEETGFTSHTLRYYEKEGVLQGVQRSTSGHRVFAKKDIDILKFIKCMKLTDMPISELKKVTTLWYSGADTIPDRIAILSKHREDMLKKVEALQETLRHIDHKIEFYENKLKK